MRSSPSVLSRLDLFAAAPNVGNLIELCEGNYALLMQLVPTLQHCAGRFLSQPSGSAALRLSIIEQAPYTTELRLTHLFRHASDETRVTGQSEPDAALRAYHDAKQLEVIGLRQTILPVLNHYASPALAAKWRANLFVSRWLSYCLRQGYRFPDSTRPAQPTSGSRALLPST
jgi:uncharacterized protein YqiB (DUF1249 family)